MFWISWTRLLWVGLLMLVLAGGASAQDIDQSTTPSKSTPTIALAAERAVTIVSRETGYLTPAWSVNFKTRAPVAQPAPTAGQTKTERSTGRTIGYAVGFGAAGAGAGALLGAAIEGSSCHCDDPGLQGMLVGMPVGAALGAVLGVWLAGR